MRGRPAGSCVNRREDTGTGTLPGHRRPHWPRRSAFRDGDLLLRLGAFGLRDLGRCVVVGDRARLLEVVPHLVALVRLPAAPQVTLVAHARDLLSRWGEPMFLARASQSSRAVGEVMTVNGARRRRDPAAEGQSPDSASPNGVPSQSRHTDQASPGWTTLPPNARTRSSASAMSGTAKYGSDAVSPGPGPRAWIPTAGPAPRV